jgi:NTE family protein
MSELTFHWVNKSPGAPYGFPNVEPRTELFKPISRAASVFGTAQGGSTIGYNRTGIPQYFLGGVGGLFAYGPNEVRGDQYYLFRAGYLNGLLTLPTFVGAGLYAVTLRDGKNLRRPRRAALGPLFVGGSVGDTGHSAWFFALGRLF